MKTKKTPQTKRDTYVVYNDRNERIAEYIAGVDGITEELIRELHRMDDHEVYVNSKEKVSCWMSIDAQPNADTEDFGGCSPLESEISVEYFDKPDSAVDCAREIVAGMSEQCRQVYDIVYIKDMRATDAAEKLNLSSSRITQIKKEIYAELSENKALRSFFRQEPESA